MPRTFGLDVCRTLAILLVVCGHTMGHSHLPAFLEQARFIGLFGVDLFFCLSGFLIGRILLVEAGKWPASFEQSLFRFWVRRWLRTLPLYYFYLFFLLRFDWTGRTSLLEQKSYLLFAQNLAWPMPVFYGLSWSLSVEEWFYLLFPLALLFFVGLGQSPRRAALFAIGVFAAAPSLARWLGPPFMENIGSLDEGLRHVVVFRLDALGCGVLVAYLFVHRRAWFDRMAACWPVFLGGLIAVIASTKMRYGDFAANPLLPSVYFSVSAIIFAGLVPAFYRFSESRFPWVNRFFRFTSLVSYSLYLGHITAFVIVIRVLRHWRIYDTIYPNPWLLYPLFIGSAFLLATLTYYTIEKPMLALRHRWFPEQMRLRVGSASSAAA